MALTAREVVDIFQDEVEFLMALDETVAAAGFVFAVDAWEQADRFATPRTLQRNFGFHELSTADWSDPEQLAEEVVPLLDGLCKFWENVHESHNAAIDRFQSASRGEAPYCLYLRNFDHVVMSSDDDPLVRVTVHHITNELDFVLQHAISNGHLELNAVSCMHTDDLGLHVGEWFLPSIRVHGHNWQAPITDAIHGAKVIVFYIGTPSEGTNVELDAIRDSGLQHRTILVCKDLAHLPADADDFVDRFELAEFVTSPEKPLTAILTDTASARLAELMGDTFAPDSVSDALLSLRCAVVDPDLNMEFADAADKYNDLCITPKNLSAFACYVVSFPDAVRDWEALAAGSMIDGERTVEDLQRNVRYAWGGAVALGLTPSIAATIGLYVVFSNLTRVKNAKEREQRKEASLEALRIAKRFNALATHHQWSQQLDEWSTMIESDAFSLP